MKTLLHTAIVALLLRTIPVVAAEAVPPKANPFDQAAQTAFAGRYVGRLDGVVVQIRLKPEGGAWTGSFVKGNRYTIQATSGPGALEGFCGNGQESFPFSVTSDGERLRFTAGTISTMLERQKFPKLADVYETKRVRLQFENRTDQTNGAIRFNGRDYPFTAAEVAGDLEGTFSDSSGSFPFTLANEPRALVFRSGSFSEAIFLKPMTNSLGMVFVGVPGTDVLFCIWETRVRDYAAYAQANAGVDGSWQKVAYKGVPASSVPDHPVSNVSWDDAKAFCEWLTRLERARGGLQPGDQYRLPTDAEWSVAVGLPEENGSTPAEKFIVQALPAAIGGEMQQFFQKYMQTNHWTDHSTTEEQEKKALDARASQPRESAPQLAPPKPDGNHDDLSSSNQPSLAGGFECTAPVGSFQPNEFGLYDLVSNVSEWCEDWFNNKQQDRVRRGFSWNQSRTRIVASSFYRGHYKPVDRYVTVGFRCVLVGWSSP